jgi:predicted SprT family Zn-dependent metalloprotease
MTSPDMTASPLPKTRSQCYTGISVDPQPIQHGLTPADRQRARFSENDPVFFGRKNNRSGHIVRLNRTTATVQCNLSGNQYLVPFEHLEHASVPSADTEEKLESIAAHADRLLKKYQLEDWRFRFDHCTRRAGCCHYHHQTISLSFDLARNAADADIQETLLHEIAHALVGKKHHHDGVWKAKAREIGASGERCHRLRFSTPRYTITCENRCWTHTAERRNSRLICKKCGGKIIYTPYSAPARSPQIQRPHSGESNCNR